MSEQENIDLQPKSEEDTTVDQSLGPAVEGATGNIGEPILSKLPETDYIDECIAKAIALKTEGTTLFSAGDIDNARLKYTAALESLQYAGDNIKLDQKASLFELTIPLSSNTALCFFKAANYAECLMFTKNVTAPTSLYSSTTSHIIVS